MFCRVDIIKKEFRRVFRRDSMIKHTVSNQSQQGKSLFKNAAEVVSDVNLYGESDSGVRIAKNASFLGAPSIRPGSSIERDFSEISARFQRDFSDFIAPNFRFDVTRHGIVHFTRV